VIGVFRDRSNAELAVDDLRKAGFSDDTIGFVGPEGKSSKRTKTKKEGSHVGEGLAVGAAAGAGVGGLVALGLLAGVIPAIGPAIAGGTLAMVLANAAGGAAIGGIAGGLVGLGIPEDEATYYENEVKAGRYVVTVRANGRRTEAVEILRRHGGYDMHTAAEAEEQHTASTRRTGARATTDEAGKSMELNAEELKANKARVKKGEVRVHKDVVTEQKTLNVPVSREEVVVERKPAGGRRTSNSIKEGEEIRIPVMAEEVHAEKEPVTTEEVHVGKRRMQDTKKVSGSVRKEQAHIEPTGDVTVRDENARDSGR
jgi:uncharacterized protein (TIGR02271 family)